MITIYLKQSYNLLKENRFVNGISIAGTALSVAAVMLIYLVYQVNFSAYAPESNRYRILFVSSLQACGSDGHPINNGGMSHKVVRECLYPLQTPEAVTAFTSGDLPVNVHGWMLAKSGIPKSTMSSLRGGCDFLAQRRATASVAAEDMVPTAVI